MIKNENNQFLENIKYALDKTASIAITDSSGVFLEVNSKFLELSGFTSGDIIGKNYDILSSHLHSSELFINLWKTVLGGNIWEGEIQNKNKMGDLYWLDTTIIPVCDSEEKVKTLITISYDITEKKENEFNLTNLFESSNDGLIIYNLSGRIVWSNTKAQEIFNEKINQRYITEIFSDTSALFRSGETRASFNSKSGLKTLEALTKEYFFKGHKCYLVIFRDISEKIQFDAQMMHQDRLANVGLLASGVAHEVGTPLGVMRGRAELLKAKSKDSDFVEKNADIFIQQIDRISKLIKSLLEVSRGNPGGEPEQVEIKKVINDLEVFISHEILKNNIKLKFNYPNEKCFVKANTSQLFQAFLNLAMNSIYSLKQKVKKLKNFEPQIEIEIKEINKMWKVSIHDNGEGIANENIKKIFSPFFSTKPLGEGTGLGLATSYRNIESWGGRMEIKSSHEEWTHISIYLLKL